MNYGLHHWSLGKPREIRGEGAQENKSEEKIATVSVPRRTSGSDILLFSYQKVSFLVEWLLNKLVVACWLTN
jgi:hypothetical protein